MRHLFTSLLFLLPTLAHAQPVDIFDAARDGDIPAITRYAKEGGDINARTEDGYTPFILATYHAHTKAAAALLKLKANPCAEDGRGSNAYMGVAFKGHAETAEWLLTHTKCDINHQNYAGQTALMMASLFGQEKVVTLYMKHGADPAIVDAQGNTAESLAKGQGLGHIIDILKFHFTKGKPKA